MKSAKELLFSVFLSRDAKMHLECRSAEIPGGLYLIRHMHVSEGKLWRDNYQRGFF